MAQLPPPIEKYLAGTNPTHTSRQKLQKYLNIEQKDIERVLKAEKAITPEGKVTKLAQQTGLVDTCEGRALWNIEKTKRLVKLKIGEPKKAQRTEPAWVDLGTIGTYFGVGNVALGKWLDQLGLRGIPTIEKNESGDYDMLDMANQAKQKQANGFIGKEPTEKALNMGAARKLTVTNRKQQEIEIVQWNLDLVKEVLVRAGHPLDTERKMSLKGKGKNSNVQVNGMDKRAKEIYTEWAKLYANPNERWKIKKLFSGQPRLLLEKVENDFMKMPGYITDGKYLKDC